MAWLIAIVLGPLLFALLAFYAVVKLMFLLVRIAFAPVVWLSGRPTRQRVQLRHYDVVLFDRERRRRH
jgi:hypothetical protein